MAMVDVPDSNDGTPAPGQAGCTMLAARPGDAATEAYADWREQCVWVRDAQRRWTGGGSGGSSVAFCRYMTALDREERAAASYATLVRRGQAGRDGSRAAAARRVDHGMGTARVASAAECHRATVRWLFGVQIAAVLLTIVTWFAIRLLIGVS